jgi:TonB family protein
MLMPAKVRGMHGRRCIAMLAACALLAGCASQASRLELREGYAADGAVSAEIVDQPDGARYQPVAGSMYFSPLPIRENAKPEYPADLLARRLPAAVVVARLVVDGMGAVERAEVIESTSEEPAFRDAVLSAVKGWTFIPLKRVTGDTIERLPFTQEYRFTFKQVNGHAVVESGRAGG